jgi:hypothetical protein
MLPFIMRYSVPLGFIAGASVAQATKLKLDTFSSLVLFGDSYTDQGVRQYRPDPDGTIPEPVRTLTLLLLLFGAPYD